MEDYELARKAATLQATVLENPWIPYEPHPRQLDYLSLDDELDVMYGGAAGGGKSDGLLLAAAQYVDEPGYSALIVRKTYSQLSKAGALMERSHKWFRGTKASWDGTGHKWRFPSGATIEFGYLDSQNDELNYQSAEYQFIGIDQVEQWESPKQPLYLMSRLRRLEGSRVPIRFRPTANPGGPGFQWVKKRYVPADDEYEDLRDRAYWTRSNWDEFLAEHVDSHFVFATLDDNPSLDREKYIRTLAHLLPIERERLLSGNWRIVEGGKVVNADWFKTFLDAPPANPVIVARGWDLAATDGDDDDPATKKTSGVRMSLAHDGLVVVEHHTDFKKGPGDRDALIEQRANLDGEVVAQLFEQEPGSGGKAQIEALARRLKKSRVEGLPPHGDKYVRLGPFASQAQAGNVALVRGDWNEGYLAELNAMQPEPPKYRGYKDAGDATSLVYNWMFPSGAPAEPSDRRSRDQETYSPRRREIPKELIENRKIADGKRRAMKKIRPGFEGMAPR